MRYFGLLLVLWTTLAWGQSEDPALAGVVLSGNESTTVLENSAAFTGQWRQVDAYSSVTIKVVSSHSGQLQADFSDDCQTETNDLDYVVVANVPEVHRLAVTSKCFRVYYLNDSGDTQTSFDIQALAGYQGILTAPLNLAYGLDSDSQVVRPTFTWLDISRGLASGITVVEKFGYSDGIGTSWTPVAMGEAYQTPTSAVSLEFVSSAAGDALNGAGAHEICVIGLDASWLEQAVCTAAHATDGQTAVAITGTWLRVYRAYVSSSGAYANATTASHVGTITIRVASAGATYAEIPLLNSFGFSQTLIGAYTIPAGYTGYVFLKNISVNSGKSADVAFFARIAADDVTTSYGGTMRAKSIITGLTGGAPFAPNGGNVPLGPYTGPADIGFLAYGASTPTVAVEFEIFLVAE